MSQPVEMTEEDKATALLVGRITTLQELVRWLSLSYGDNEPVFAGADGMGSVNGLPLGSAPQLHTLWHQVTGRPHHDPDLEREKVRCETCGAWSVVTNA